MIDWVGRNCFQETVSRSFLSNYEVFRTQETVSRHGVIKNSNQKKIQLFFLKIHFVSRCVRDFVTWQHTATRCNTLQHAATRCNTLQHTDTLWHDGPSPLKRNVLQRVAACCSVLHCVAVCCSVLQRVAVCLSATRLRDSVPPSIAVCCCVLQRVAACCSVLQCVAVCCSVLQCVAACRRVL